MAATQQPPTPDRGPADKRARAAALRWRPTSATASAAARAGASRVCPRRARPAGADRRGAPPQLARPVDVSPLAAVIGIALLGGMLLIGVLIGRGGAETTPAPAPIVQVGEAGERHATPATGGETGGAPAAAIQRVAARAPTGSRSSSPRCPRTARPPETRRRRRRRRRSTEGAIDAAVLDSDLYASLPPGNYVIYSGVYTDRRSAEVALKGLRTSFPTATVIEVSRRRASRPAGDAVPAGSRRLSSPATAARTRSRRRRPTGGAK